MKMLEIIVLVIIGAFLIAFALSAACLNLKRKEDKHK